MHRSIEVSKFKLALTQTPPWPATFEPERPFAVSHDDAASLLYAKIEEIGQAISFRNEPDKNLELAEWRYKPRHDHCVWLIPILAKDTSCTWIGPPCSAPSTESMPQRNKIRCCARNKYHSRSWVRTRRSCTNYKMNWRILSPFIELRWPSAESILRQPWRRRKWEAQITTE